MSVTDAVRVGISVSGGPEAIAQVAALRTEMQALNGQKLTLTTDVSGVKTLASEAKTASTEVSTLSQQMQKAGAASQAMSGNISGAAKSAVAFGGAAVGVAAVAAGFVVVSKAAADFQQEMANLQAVLNVPTSNLGDLATSIQDASRATVFTSSQIAEADRQLAKAGQDSTQIISEQTDVLHLSSATMVTAAEGATAYVTAMKDFNLTSADSTTIADTLSKAVDSSVGTLADMTQALKQVGPVASQAGLDLKTTTTAIADLENAGLQGDAGNALKIFLQRLEAPTAGAKKAMADLGLQVYDTNGQLLSLSAIFDEIQAKTRGLDDETKNLDLTKIFGARGVRVADIAAEQGSSGLTDVTAHEAQLGSAAEIAAQKLNTLQGQVKQLGSSLNVIAVDIGNVAIPQLQQYAAGLTEVANVVSKVTGQFGDTAAQQRLAKGLNPIAILTGDDTGDLGAQQAKIDQYKRQIADLENAHGSFVNTIARNFPTAAHLVAPQTLLLPLPSIETSGSQLEVYKAQLADAETAYAKFKSQIEDTPGKALTSLNSDIATIENSQRSLDLRSGDSFANISQHAADAKKYIDFFGESFIKSGHTVQEWQDIEAQAFADIDRNAANSRATLSQTMDDAQKKSDDAKRLLSIGVPQDVVSAGIFHPDTAEGRAALKQIADVEKQAKASAQEVTNLNKAFDDADKAAASVDLTKGIEGLIAKLPALKDAQTQLASLGQDTGALTNLDSIAQGFRDIADSQAAVSQEFTGFQASISHTDSYVSEVDKLKKQYADTEQYIKNKPLAALTDKDKTFLQNYPQYLASLNNESDKLQESNVGKLLDMSKVIPDFASFNQAFDQEVQRLGGAGALQVQIALDIDDVKAKTKVDNAIKMIESDSPAVETTVALSGNEDAQRALDELDGTIKGIPTTKEITALATVLGLTDVQSLALLISGLQDKTVAVNVVTGGGLPNLVTTPGVDPTRGYASGGTPSSDWAIVGDNPGGGINRTTEAVNFRTKQVLSHDQAMRMGLFGGGSPHYDSGTIDIGNAADTSGPYNRTNPGPGTALDKPIKAATGATKDLNTSLATTATTLVDIGDRANVFAGILGSLNSEGLKAVSSELDKQLTINKQLADQTLGAKATAEEKAAAEHTAETQAVDTTIAFARAVQDARDPANDLSADFQRIRDSGAVNADNLIRQVSIMREISVSTAAIAADQQRITDLDNAHTATVTARQQADTAASRAKTEAGWQQQAHDAAIQNAQRLTQYQWTLDSARLDDTKTAEERNYQDATTNAQRLDTLQMRSLTDQLTAMTRLQTTANSGNSALEQSLSSQMASGSGSTKFQAGELLSIQKDFDSRNRQTLSDQIAGIKDAQLAEQRNFEDTKYNLDQQHTISQRNFADEATAAQRNHAQVQQDWANEAAQRQAMATQQQISDTRAQWALEDRRQREDAIYTATKSADDLQLKIDTDRQTRLTAQLNDTQSIEALWEKINGFAGSSGNTLLTVLPQLADAIQNFSNAIGSGTSNVRRLGGSTGLARGA